MNSVYECLFSPPVQSCLLNLTLLVYHLAVSLSTLLVYLSGQLERLDLFSRWLSTEPIKPYLVVNLTLISVYPWLSTVNTFGN